MTHGAGDEVGRRMRVKRTERKYILPRMMETRKLSSLFSLIPDDPDLSLN